MVKIDHNKNVAHVFIGKWITDEDYIERIEAETGHSVRRTEERHYTFFKSFPFTDIWIGYDPAVEKHDGTRITKDACWWCGGNTVLLNMGRKSYMYIGGCIYTFKTQEEIESYVSEMGNNAVPYPYATSKTKTYLMLECVEINNRFINPYGVYYASKNQNIRRKADAQRNKRSPNFLATAFKVTMIHK